MDFLREMVAEGLKDGMISFNLTSNGVVVLVYVLQALALYTLAQRRDIKKPWLAWIPIVNVWILGSLSDQYQYVVKGQVKNKRKILLGTSIAMVSLAAIVGVAALWVLLDALKLSFDALTNLQLTDGMIYTLVEEYLSVMLLITLLSIPLAVVSVIYAVYFYIALYDVYRSSEPNNTTLYLVLSLVGNTIVEGAYCIFLILCKDKDLGMPPRKQNPESAAQPNSEE